MAKCPMCGSDGHELEVLLLEQWRISSALERIATALESMRRQYTKSKGSVCTSELGSKADAP
jgi:hypothetical protein